MAICLAVAVEAVGHGVDDGHRAGQRELELALRVGPRQLRLEGMHAALQPQRRHHLRHHRVVAVVADAHLHLVLEVDAFDALEEAVHEVLARLLAVAHDVQAGVLLRLDPQQRGVGLGLAQFVALRLPLRPELAGLGQPRGLGQAAGGGGGEHGGLLGGLASRMMAESRRRRTGIIRRMPAPAPADPPPYRHHRLRLRRAGGGPGAARRAGGHHAGGPHQPPPVPAAALPGGDRRPVGAGDRRARAAPVPQAGQRHHPAGRSGRHRRRRAPGHAGRRRHPALRPPGRRRRRHPQLLRARRLGAPSRRG